MRPAHANAGRKEAFRAVLRRPAVVSGMVVAPSAALVLGAATGGAAVALAAPIVVLAAILVWAWRSAERAAERAFWRAVAEALEFEPFTELGELQRTTPLLHAGERRGFSHGLRGPLGDSGLTAKLARYDYEVRREDRNGNGVWEKHRFTVCALDLDAGV